MDFRLFLENDLSDVKATIAKLPAKQQKLVKDYKFVFQNKNTLKGDKTHVGLVDEKTKTITIANAWSFSRQFTILHEFAHIFYKYNLNNNQKEAWKKLVSKPHKLEEKNPEELFAMVFATIYADHPPTTYQIKSWIQFIKKAL